MNLSNKIIQSVESFVESSRIKKDSVLTESGKILNEKFKPDGYTGFAPIFAKIENWVLKRVVERLKSKDFIEDYEMQSGGEYKVDINPDKKPNFPDSDRQGTLRIDVSPAAEKHIKFSTQFMYHSETKEGQLWRKTWEQTISETAGDLVNVYIRSIQTLFRG